MTEEERFECYKLKADKVYNLIVKYDMKERVFWASALHTNNQVLAS